MMFLKKEQETGGETRLEGPRFSIPAAVRYTVLGVLLLAFIAMQAGKAERTSGIAMAVILVACLFGKAPRRNLGGRLSLAMGAAFAYFLVNCAAGLYARFGGIAAVEFGKILGSFSVYLIVILRARREELPQLSAMAAGVSAVVGLVSIDASSLGLLTRWYLSFADNFLGTRYLGYDVGYEAGTRITGIFGNPNVLGGFLAIGIFLSLYLMRHGSTRRGRLGAALLLGVNAVSFLLAFSMGAIAMFVLAVGVYLLTEAKGKRLSLFLLLGETAVVALLVAFVTFPRLGTSSPVPVLAALAGGVLLWAVHEWGGIPLAQRLTVQGKTAALAAGGLAGALALYVFLALNLTGGVDLGPGQTLRRSVYPKPGDYQLSATWTGDNLWVSVETQNRNDTIMHTSTLLYDGPMDTTVAFTVPEDSDVVWFNLRSEGETKLDRLALTDGPRVKLGYPLLPGFVANRLQGLRANQNAIQRLAFFQDGLRIYAESPLIGSGLGAVDGMVFSVQDFYYESKYVHNHYIQVLAEMGIPGLVTFTAMLATAGWTLLRRREERSDPLFPALCACLAMIALHALTEVDWSTGQYQVMALLVLGLVAVRFPRPLAVAEKRGVGLACLGVAGLVCGGFAVLLAGNLYAVDAYDRMKTGQLEQTATSMTELATLDRYNWTQYKLDLAVNAAQSSNPKYADLAEEYARECRALRVHTMNNSLEVFVYLPMKRYEEFFTASREGITQAASKQATWVTEFQLYETLVNGLDETELANLPWFADQVLATAQMLAEYNDGRMQQIVLPEEQQAFIQRMRDAGGTGVTPTF